MFLLWLKYHAKRFSQTAINTYPLGTQAVAIVSQVTAGFIIDRTGQRLPMVIAGALLQLVTAALLLVRNLSDAGIFTAFYLSGTSFVVNPIMFSWANEICSRSGDDAARSVVLYVMSMGGQLLYTWWGIVLYPATDVPYWKKGSITMIVVCGVFIGTAFIVRWVSHYDPETLRIFFQTDIINSLTGTLLWLPTMRQSHLVMVRRQLQLERRRNLAKSQCFYLSRRMGTCK